MTAAERTRQERRWRRTAEQWRAARRQQATRLFAGAARCQTALPFATRHHIRLLLLLWLLHRCLLRLHLRPAGAARHAHRRHAGGGRQLARIHHCVLPRAHVHCLRTCTGRREHLLVDRLLYAPRLRTLAPLVVLACRLYGRALVRFFKRHSVSARARCQPHRRRWIRTQCIGVGDRRRRPGRLCHCRRLRLHCRVACLGSRSACRRRLLRRGCWLGAHHAVHFGLGRFQVCLGRRGECCLGAGHVKWRLLGRCLGKRSLEAGHVR
mmetsp:Transcript_39971/g.119014  ORF Transcript_39971/g.119014 Transcript_39971/m.119014 type:complete len:266 (-) Transcript_39971:278-1075(-)